MGYRRVCRDQRHWQITSELEQACVSVADTSMVGGGFPDLVVGAFGVTLLVELKSPRKVHHRKGDGRNDAQKTFADLWRGTPVVCAQTTGEILEALAVRAFKPAGG
jgi:hypothetical protein